MPELDDQRLLEEFVGRNSEPAFAVLVARRVNLVYSAALRFTRNPHYAEEITQAVFIILARKAGSLRRGVVLSGWLYQTTRLTSANFVKGEIRRQRREQEVYMQSTLNGPDAAAWEEIRPLLDDAMGGLGKTDRNAVVLRFFENKTAREVAAALKLTEAAAHKRVNRALDKLRKFLAQHGVTSTTNTLAGMMSAHTVHSAPAGLAKTMSTVALAKGAAVPTSTLTLIKGALKIMAWTKIRTAAISGMIVLFAATLITAVGIRLARAHHVTVQPVMGLSPIMETATIDLQLDGTVLIRATVEETNNTSRTINADNINDGEGIYRATDESGKSMRIIKRPQGGIFVMLNKTVPPGGKITYTVEGRMTGLIKKYGENECEVGFQEDLGNATRAYVVQVWRLPVGATLLGKDSDMEATTNAGQVEMRISKQIPPDGRFHIGFHYHLPANGH